MENNNYLVLLLYSFDFVKFHRSELEKQSTIKKQFVRVNFFCWHQQKLLFEFVFLGLLYFRSLKTYVINMDFSVYIHYFFFTLWNTHTNTLRLLYSTSGNENSKKYSCLGGWIQYIAYITCYLQCPRSESPMVSFQRCVKSDFCMEFFSSLFSFWEMIICIFGMYILESICLSCGTACVTSGEKQRDIKLQPMS